MTPSRRLAAVFLDRDGTLVRDVRHGADPAAFEPLPGAMIGLAALQRRRYRLVVVTNQSGVARGLFSLEEARAAGRYLAAGLGVGGIRLSGYYFCPHHVDGAVPAYARACDCRKPAPGLLHRAADEIGISSKRSWMIGDSLSDAQAGRAAGVRTVLIDNGSASVADIEASGALVARNLAHAVAIVLAEDGKLPGAGTFGLDPVAAADLGPRADRDDRATGDASPWPDPLVAACAGTDQRALLLLTMLGKGSVPKDAPPPERGRTRR